MKFTLDDIRRAAGERGAEHVYTQAMWREMVKTVLVEYDATLDALSKPETERFVRGVYLEACHQVTRWGTAHDRGKAPADWFWLVGYLAGKALASQLRGDTGKALHHTISAAAALCNWYSAIRGIDTRMTPGKSDIEEIIGKAFGDDLLPEPAKPALNRRTTGWACRWWWLLFGEAERRKARIPL